MIEPTRRDHPASFFDFGVDAIVLADADSVIRWAGAATPTVLGYEPGDLIGIRLCDLVEPTDRDRWQQFFDGMFDQPGVACRGAFRHRRKDGGVRWVEGVARNLLHEPRVGAIAISYRDVTERKEAESVVKSAEDRYGHLFALATDIIFEADAEGYFRFVNPRTLLVFEYALNEVIGRRFTEFIRPDYRDQILNHYYLQTTRGVPSSYVEFPALTRSGREVWLGQNAWLIKDGRGTFIGMQAVARDITERRRAEDALRAAEAKYRGLVEQSLVGVYILQHGRLVYVNPKAAQMLQYTQQELVDAPSAFVFVHDQDRQVVIDQLERLSAGAVPSVNLMLRGLRKDGEVVQVEASASMTEFGGEPAVLATVMDVSDRVKLEEQLRQAQKMEAIGRLAGGIAHDFNNLLTAIRGNAELMSHKVKRNPAMAAEVEEILHAADRAASLTRQLLAFSRKQVLQPVALDLNAIVSGVARMTRRLIGTEAHMRLDLGEGLPHVLADPAQIEQVLLNLIVNARDAMPSGGTINLRTATARLEASSPEITQAGIAPGAFVLLEVTDTGTGMDHATQARIFEPFFTTKETGRGTGLGLSTVYGIVRQTGGAITVESALGEGAKFRVYLPAITGEAL